MSIRSSSASSPPHELARARPFGGAGGRAAALVLLVVLALGLRATGIDFLLPHYEEGDCGPLVHQLDCFEGRSPADPAHPFWGFYPQLTSRMASLWPGIVPGTGDRPPLALEQHLARAGSSYLRVRETVALVGLLAVPGTYLLARSFLGAGWSLVAAAFAATSFLHLWFSQQARPHVVVTSAFLATVLAAVHLRRKPTVGKYVLAGIAVGLAIASLQSGVVALLPLAAAYFLRERGERTAAPWWIAGTLALAVAIAWSFYPATDPAAAQSPGQSTWFAYDSDQRILYLQGHIVPLWLFNGSGFLTVGRTMWDYDPLIFSLAFAGALLGVWCLARRAGELVRGRRRDLLVVLAFALPYLLAIGGYGRTYQRFVLPLVPFASVLAAFSLYEFGALVARTRWPRLARLATAALVTALLGAQTFAAWKLATIRARPDTAELAARWITEHLDPARDRIAVLPGIDLPLAKTERARIFSLRFTRPLGYPWLDYQIACGKGELPAPLFDLFLMPLSNHSRLDLIRQKPDDFVRGLAAEYAVVESYAVPRRADVLVELYDAVVRGGQRVARFSPDGWRPNAGLPLAYQDDDLPVRMSSMLRTLRAEHVGPVIEIYRLREDAR